MKVLFYCLLNPCDLAVKMNGPRRYSRVLCESLKAVGIDVTTVDSRGYTRQLAEHLEKQHDIVHTDVPDILTDQLSRGVVPDVIGAHCWSPNKYYDVIEGGFYSYPGYEDRGGDLYDSAVWIRNNFQEENSPEDLRRIRIVQPAIETNEIRPASGQKFEHRKLFLWAGDRSRPEKNWDLMERIASSVKLPKEYEWRFLTNYTEKEYLQALDQTALMVYTSHYESFGFQLFEAWAKAVPVVYPASLWGELDFHGCGGLPIVGKCRGLNAYLKAIHDFLELPMAEKERTGLLSRSLVERDFSLHRMGRELKLIYSQIISARGG